jgi:hypothetical protein
MPNFEEPGNYVRANFERDDRLAIVLINRASGRVAQEIRTAEKIASPGYQAHLRAANAGGSCVFVSMNALNADAAGRTKADVAEIRHVYLDFDEGGWQAVQRVLDADQVPRPHHVLETSPGKHQVIWRVEGFKKEQAEGVQRGMAANFGSDPAASDCSRVLRLPGFRNCKYADAHYIRDVPAQQPNERLYSPDDFPRYDLARLTLQDRAERRPRAVNGHSQSERDFGYAMRQLARGTPVDVIKAEIEAFRQDKPNPRYYAGRTVDRAYAKHLSKPSPMAEASATAREPDGLAR